MRGKALLWRSEEEDDEEEPGSPRGRAAKIAAVVAATAEGFDLPVYIYIHPANEKKFAFAVMGHLKSILDTTDAERAPDDATGTCITDYGWWEQHRITGAAFVACGFLLYPDGVETKLAYLQPSNSTAYSGRGTFVHASPPPLLKWTERARAGAVATRFGWQARSCKCPRLALSARRWKIMRRQ